MSNQFTKPEMISPCPFPCKLCGKILSQLPAHVRKVHGMDPKAYLSRFPGAPAYTQDALDRIRAGQKRRWRRGNPSVTPSVTPLVSPSITPPVTPLVSPSITPPVTPSSEETWEYCGYTLPKRKSIGDHVPLLDLDFCPDDRTMEALILSVKLNENILIVGPTGCGKTHHVLQLASRLNQPLVRVNMTGDIRVADFVGERVVELDKDSGESIITFQYGLLPQAMREGWWLLIDEFDAMPSAIGFVLQSVLEGGDLVLKENGGEIIKRHPDFRLMATANTRGKGDATGLYTGTQILNEATLDRFGICVAAQYLPYHEEVKLIQAKSGITDVRYQHLFSSMVRVATLVREGASKGECEASFSTRRLIAWAKLYVSLKSIGLAADLAFLNKQEDAEKDYLLGIINRVMPAGK